MTIRRLARARKKFITNPARNVKRVYVTSLRRMSNHPIRTAGIAGAILGLASGIFFLYKMKR